MHNYKMSESNSLRLGVSAITGFKIGSIFCFCNDDNDPLLDSDVLNGVVMVLILVHYT